MELDGCFLLPVWDFFVRSRGAFCADALMSYCCCRRLLRYRRYTARRPRASLGRLGVAGHGDEVDAVAVASVREVVAEVRAIDRHALAVAEAADVVPVDLLVAERRPAVRLGLGDELLEGAACFLCVGFTRRSIVPDVSSEKPPRDARRGRGVPSRDARRGRGTRDTASNPWAR